MWPILFVAGVLYLKADSLGVERLCVVLFISFCVFVSVSHSKKKKRPFLVVLFENRILLVPQPQPKGLR